MPLLEQYYFGSDDTFWLFAPAHVDSRNDARISKSEDIVHIKGVIVSQSISPMFEEDGSAGLIFPGANLPAKYRPAALVAVVGANRVRPFPVGQPIPDPPIIDFTTGDPSPMGIMVRTDGSVEIGSLPIQGDVTGPGFFSIFFEPCYVDFEYVAAVDRPPTTPPGNASGAPGPFGVRKVSRS